MLPEACARNVLLMDSTLRVRTVGIGSGAFLVVALAVFLTACTYSATAGAHSGPATIGIPEKVDLWDCEDARDGPTLADFDKSLWLPVGADPAELEPDRRGRWTRRHGDDDACVVRPGRVSKRYRPGVHIRAPRGNVRVRGLRPAGLARERMMRDVRWFLVNYLLLNAYVFALFAVQGVVLFASYGSVPGWSGSPIEQVVSYAGGSLFYTAAFLGIPVLLVALLAWRLAVRLVGHPRVTVYPWRPSLLSRQRFFERTEPFYLAIVLVAALGYAAIVRLPDSAALPPPAVSSAGTGTA